MQKCKEIFLSIFTFSTEKKFSQVQSTDIKGYKKKMAISHTRGGGGGCEFSHFFFLFDPFPKIASKCWYATISQIFTGWKTCLAKCEEGWKNGKQHCSIIKQNQTIKSFWIQSSKSKDLIFKNVIHHSWFLGETESIYSW